MLAEKILAGKSQNAVVSRLYEGRCVLGFVCTMHFSPRARGEKTLVVRRKLPCGKWKLLILRELLAGASRFGELRRNLSGISEKMLSQHLRELESDGLLLGKSIRKFRRKWNIG